MIIVNYGFRVKPRIVLIPEACGRHPQGRFMNRPYTGSAKWPFFPAGRFVWRRRWEPGGGQEGQFAG